MRDWISEHRMAIIAIVLVVGLFGFLLTQKGSNSNGSSANNAADTTQSVNWAEKMRRGNNDATVSLVQYSDFLCPSCSYVSTQVMPEIDKQYIQSGKVKFEFRPMAFIADGSVQAGMGAYCAIEQDKFWQYHDAIYTYVAAKVFRDRLDPTKDTILTPALVKSIAANAGVDKTLFDTCLDSKKHLSDITAATKKANAEGVKSTPYITVNGRAVAGNPTYETIDAMIKAAL